MRRRLLLTGAAALGGCSLLSSVPYVQRRDWPLDAHRASTSPSPPRGRTLLVRTVRAGPGLDVRGLQWLQSDGSVHIDFYEQWAVQPAQAAEDGLRRWLADAGLFSAVVAPGSRLNVDFNLEGELNTFVADLKTGMARVALALVLMDQRPTPIKVLLQKTESAEVRLTGSEPPAIADAMKAALAEVLRQSEADVAAAVR
jgi:cholesterol transport system auxiliary component